VTETLISDLDNGVAGGFLTLLVDKDNPLFVIFILKTIFINSFSIKNNHWFSK
jgi:hypothetical protein